MKTTTALLSLISAAAAAENVTLVTESSNDDTNQKGLYSVHEGAGYNGVFLTDSKTTFTLDGGNITQELPGFNYVLGEWDNQLVFTAGAPFGAGASVKDDYVTVNGSNSVFYACKPGERRDPYGYSQQQWDVVVYGSDESAPSDCLPIKIKVEANSTSSSESAPASSPAPATTSAPAAPAKETSGHYNATVTKEETKYTTIECSTPTTFAYGGSTYTVSSATTLTVKDCSCTDTPSAPKATAPPSVASATPSAAVPVANGAPALQLSTLGSALAVAAGLLLI